LRAYPASQHQGERPAETRSPAMRLGGSYARHSYRPAVPAPHAGLDSWVRIAVRHRTPLPIASTAPALHATLDYCTGVCLARRYGSGLSRQSYNVHGRRAIRLSAISQPPVLVTAPALCVSAAHQRAGVAVSSSDGNHVRY